MALYYDKNMAYPTSILIFVMDLLRVVYIYLVHKWYIMFIYDSVLVRDRF